MSELDHRVPHDNRGAVRVFLFLLLFNLLPVPWYFFVAAGLAPPVVFLVVGLKGLFSIESGTLGFGAAVVVLALISAGLCYLLAWLSTAAVGRLRAPWVRTTVLVVMLALGTLAAVRPIYVYGGHSQSSALSLLGFVDLLADLKIPVLLARVYLLLLAGLLMGLLVYQHQATPRLARMLSETWQRTRRVRRYGLVSGALAVLALFGWTHRTLLVTKPLAHFGVPAAQYHLARAIMAQPGAEFQGDDSFTELLAEAARNGHVEAALLLVQYAPTREKRRQWLQVAAERGHGGAQFRLYRSLLRGAPAAEARLRARDWLQKAADNGHADARYALANYMLAGNAPMQIAKDVDQARLLLEAAARDAHYASMEALAWRYEKGYGGFPRDPQRAITLYNRVAAGYAEGLDGLPVNPALAADRRARARSIADTEARLARGDAQAQARVGRELLRQDAAPETIAAGINLLEKAAGQGDPQLQYEFGAIFLFGRHGIETDFPRGRAWWEKALAQKHVETMAQVARAHQNGRFDYPVDLLKSRKLVALLIEAYTSGRYGVEPDPEKALRWRHERQHLDRLVQIAGGDYQPPEDLTVRAETGDTAAQYQLGRQMIVSGPQAFRQKGYQWIRRAAENGYAEAQYRLVTYYERHFGIMRKDPAHGVAFLRAAADQNHLPAMGALALAYEKGRHGLARDHRKAVDWYQRVIEVHASGNYQGEIDARFMPFQRSRLAYARKALEAQKERARRYHEASPLERRIIAVEDSYRREYEKAVNALDRRDGSPEGRRKTRLAIERLRAEYARQRDAEIARLKKAHPRE